MRRHDLDPLSLVAGLVCVAIALAALFGDAKLGTAQRWVAPVLLIGIGLAGLVRYARRDRSG